MTSDTGGVQNKAVSQPSNQKEAKAMRYSRADALKSSVHRHGAGAFHSSQHQPSSAPTNRPSTRQNTCERHGEGGAIHTLEARRRRRFREPAPPQTASTPPPRPEGLP